MSKPTAAAIAAALAAIKEEVRNAQPAAVRLGDILPTALRTMAGAAEQEPFRATTKLPRHANKHLVARAINKVVFDKLPEGEALQGLTSSEREYVLAVAAEFRAWSVERRQVIKNVEAAAEAPLVEAK